MNKVNGFNRNLEGDAVECVVDCVGRDEVVQVIKTNER